MARTSSSQPTPPPKLRPEDWSLAAARQIAEGGVASVAVEDLARRLGVTKGSFYWHFPDRQALIAAALADWERAGTTEIVERLSAVADPRRRLRRLVDESFGAPDAGTDVSLAANVTDPLVREVNARVTQARIAFLEQAYRDLGLRGERARRQARIAYSAYLGHGLLQRSLPEDPLVAWPLRTAYLDQLFEAMMLPR